MANSPSPPRIHTGPRTWALIREAYLAGETAQAVCARFGVKTDALRAQATRNGWTKRAYADSLVDPAQLRRRPPKPTSRDASGEPAPERPTGPVDVNGLAHAVLREAVFALEDGRNAEAAHHLKMAESLSKLTHALPPPPSSVTPEALRQEAAEAAAEYAQDVWNAATRLAGALLTDGRGIPAAHTRAAFAWRADHLGPEAAAADRARAEHGGWSASVYDPEGRIRPPQTFEEFAASLRGR